MVFPLFFSLLLCSACLLFFFYFILFSFLMMALIGLSHCVWMCVCLSFSVFSFRYMYLCVFYIYPCRDLVRSLNCVPQYVSMRIRFSVFVYRFWWVLIYIKYKIHNIIIIVILWLCIYICELSLSRSPHIYGFGEYIRFFSLFACKNFSTAAACFFFCFVIPLLLLLPVTVCTYIYMFVCVLCMLASRSVVF